MAFEADGFRMSRRRDDAGQLALTVGALVLAIGAGVELDHRGT